ncbi:MAG TPA: hypothetical protein VIM98_01335 [Dyella sp.]|uniref:hypothetical protein n=1 Tax=Dyella sp. TaxID=1869338 RepID=UPI002F95FA8B
MKGRHIFAGAVVLTSALVAGYAFYGVRAEATVQLAGNSCPPDQPIMVSFHNNTLRSIDGGYLILEALRDGSGPNLFAEPDKSFFFHMEPLESAVECLSDSNFYFSGMPSSYGRYDMSEITREIRVWQDKARGVNVYTRYVHVDH